MAFVWIIVALVAALVLHIPRLGFRRLDRRPVGCPRRVDAPDRPQTARRSRRPRRSGVRKCNIARRLNRGVSPADLRRFPEVR